LDEDNRRGDALWSRGKAHAMNWPRRSSRPLAGKR
jgi:hypothetical protein